jgi:hypothetical protein
MAKAACPLAVGNFVRRRVVGPEEVGDHRQVAVLVVEEDHHRNLGSGEDCRTLGGVAGRRTGRIVAEEEVRRSHVGLCQVNLAIQRRQASFGRET